MLWNQVVSLFTSQIQGSFEINFSTGEGLMDTVMRSSDGGAANTL
jgi:hypothetical protein